MSVQKEDKNVSNFSKSFHMSVQKEDKKVSNFSKSFHMSVQKEDNKKFAVLLVVFK